MPGFWILPLGSHEYHGPHLPYGTDSLIAHAIASAIAGGLEAAGDDTDSIATHYELQVKVLPTLPLSCSHEWCDSLSLQPKTLLSVLDDVAHSIPGMLLLVNAHGGNHLIENWVLATNRRRPFVWWFPRSHNWEAACAVAGIDTPWGDDVHAGEIETSIMLHAHPSEVGNDLPPDNPCSRRRLWSTTGMTRHAPYGVIGYPSRATGETGARLLSALAGLACDEVPIFCRHYYDHKERGSVPFTYP